MENNQKLTTIYIVRHGETEMNVKDIVQGQPTDSSLTEKGEKEARERAEQLKNVRFDAIFSSDLGRTVRTAKILKLDRQLAVNTTRMLRERFFGVWEGKRAAEYYQANAEAFKKFEFLAEEEKRKYKVFNSIESEEEMMSRFVVKLREIAATFVGKTVLVVSHGSIMRTFLIHLGYGTRKILSPGSLANMAYIQLNSDGVDFFIEKVIGYKKPNIDFI